MPDAMRVEYEFAGRGDKPPVHLTWYQGIYQPEWLSVYDKKSAVLFEGENGRLLVDYGTRKLFLEPGLEAHDVPQVIPDSPGHHKEWTNAIKTGSKTTSPFEYGGLLTESGLLGNVSYRAGQKKITWDPVAARVTDCPEADQYCTPSTGPVGRSESEARREHARVSTSCFGHSRRISPAAPLLPIEIGKRLARFGQPLEERRRFPPEAVFFLEMADAVVDLFEADRVGVEHRAAAEGGEAVAVDVHDVDIDRAERVAFVEDVGPFVDQAIDRPLDDLFLRDGVLLDVPLFHGRGDDPLGLGIGQRRRLPFS